MKTLTKEQEDFVHEGCRDDEIDEAEYKYKDDLFLIEDIDRIVEENSK